MLDYSKHERSPKLYPTNCFLGITQVLVTGGRSLGPGTFAVRNGH